MNRHLESEPCALVEGSEILMNSDIDRTQRRYSATLEVWKQRRLAFEESVIETLPEGFSSASSFLKMNMRRIMREQQLLRTVVALLCPLDNIEAARWRLQYDRIARFLQQSDVDRENAIDRNPEDFLPWFGNSDVVYAAAVYLDSNPDGRFKRNTSYPRLDDAFVIDDMTADTKKALSEACKEGASPPLLLQNLFDSSRDPKTKAECTVALTALGVDLSNREMGSADQWCAKRSQDSLRDPAFRALSSKLLDWVNPQKPSVSRLESSESAVVFSLLAGALVQTQGGPNSPSLFQTQNERLMYSCWAEKYAHALAGVSDDLSYNLAVALDTIKPGNDNTGNALCLLSRIVESRNIQFVLLKPPETLLWGISTDEVFVPPQVAKVVWDLARAARRISHDLGVAFLERFIQSLANEVRSQLTFLFEDSTSTDATLNSIFATNRPPPQFDLMRGQDSADAIQMAQDLESQIFSNGMRQSEVSTEGVLRLAREIAKDHPLDAVLLLARLSQYPAEVRDSIFLTASLEMLPQVADEYYQAVFLRRVRHAHFSSNDSLQRLWHERVGDIQSPILKAYSAGRLGKYLCHRDFPWNTSDLLGLDPGWIAASGYCALTELLEQTSEVSNAGAKP